MAAWVQRRDLLWLLPVWNLFTSDMIAYDFELHERELLADGDFSEWVEIPTVPPRRVFSGLWNPRKRVAATFRDITTIVLVLRLREQREHIRQTAAYQHLEQYIRTRWAPGTTFQFSIVIRDARMADPDPQLVYLSEPCRT